MFIAAHPENRATVRRTANGSDGRMRREAGAVYLALLFFVAIMGTILAVTGVVWSTVQKRDKERELLFIGSEFRQAIGKYYESTPGTIKRYPSTFKDLLQGNRQLALVHHLRRVYADPMTSKLEWGIVRAPDGGIMGVYSLSTEKTVKRKNFGANDIAFDGVDGYQQWRFVYEPIIPTTMPRRP
jgi:type II secretory pathway pseudopilin PulG